MFVGYVINLNHRTDRLYNFYQHPDAKYFERVAAIDKTAIQQLDNSVGGEFLFDNRYIKETHRRDVTSGEIGCTLSHIKCWQKIANHSKLEDDDFAVVAEDDVVLCEEFANYICELQKLLKDFPNVHLILLQRLEYEQDNSLDFAGEDTRNFQLKGYDNSRQFDNHGSALYLIKKKQVKEILNTLSSTKPSWLADGFSQFCEHNRMRILSPLLGKIINGAETESDLELDRQESRKQII
ncbi:glycosyltransferase family 25 protein [Glaesserella parasuis]|nr:glycosyltransferase family 25 protein [Glaesserella parasuis]